LNRRIILLYIFVLIIFGFSGAASASDEVGVNVGQSAAYTYSVSLTYRDTLNGSLLDSVPYSVVYVETITIQEISGTNIWFQSVRNYLADQTNETNLGWIDINTGEGPASGYIILADCNEGDLIYPNWEGGAQPLMYVYRVNDTILLKQGDETIEVNHANVTTAIYNQTANYDATEFFNQTTTLDYYWEKATGLLLGFTEYSVKEQANVTETAYYQFHKVGLQQVFYPLIDKTENHVTVDSNSAILGFEFNQRDSKINFSVMGEDETSIFCNFAVPNGLLWGNLSLLLDGSILLEGVDYTKTSNLTHNIFQVTYTGDGVHTIELVNSNDIPEFPDIVILSTFMAAISVAAIIYTKKLHQKEPEKFSRKVARTI
jgi:hypothetical protein